MQLGPGGFGQKNLIFIYFFLILNFKSFFRPLIFPSIYLSFNLYRRVEHHDHAVVSGRLAGENMTGIHPFRNCTCGSNEELLYPT